jgi:hypothetical protein
MYEVHKMFKLCHFQNENSIEISVFHFHGICRKNYFIQKKKLFLSSRFIHIRLILEMFCGFTSFMWGILEVPKETLSIFPYFQIKSKNIKN